MWKGDGWVVEEVREEELKGIADCRARMLDA